jgi:Uma2 family endonuclease
VATFSAPAPVHRLSSDEYHRMVDCGALEQMRVELADGLLVEVSPQSEQHWKVIQALMRLMAARMDILRVQAPLAAAEGWTPEPDIALAEVDDDPWLRPSTALLVVEVAVSSHQYDLRKAKVFAQAAIPTYWIVDVPGRHVLAYTEPGPEGYTRERTLRPADELDPGVSGIEPFTVGDLFVTALGAGG